MKNIVTYVKENNEDFSVKPFNRADALILSWASYFCYPEIFSGDEGMTVGELNEVRLPDSEMFTESFVPQKSKKLFIAMTQSDRFRNLRLFSYRAEKDDFPEKQFAAIGVQVAPNEYFLSFRGTDPSFSGWREDFNMSCRFPVPFQQAAFEYTREVMKRHPSGKFYLGGHSKGGNAAVYAAMKADGELRERILTVFNFDGPGFLFKDDTEAGYENIRPKIVKIIPQSSFVGMLFETGDVFSIVKSRGVGVLQHDPFTWEMKDDDFCAADNRTKSSVKIESAINRWILEIPLAERERFISITYDSFNSLGIKDFNVFFKTFYKQFPALYAAYKRLPEDDKLFLRGKVKLLLKLFKEKEDKAK